MINLKNLKLLYVEDDISGREITSMFLKEFFKDVVMASDGKEALELFKNDKFDVVISDINMPYMNGIELFKEIRKLDKNIPLILISAHEKDMLNEHDLIVDGYISKPIDIDEFMQTLQKVSEKVD